LDTAFTWIKRHGQKRFVGLVRLWGDARQVANGEVTKVVYEMWTYLRMNMKFTRFTCFTYTTLGLYVLFSVGRDQRAFREIVKQLPDGGG